MVAIICNSGISFFVIISLLFFVYKIKMIFFLEQKFKDYQIKIIELLQMKVLNHLVYLT